MTRAERRARSIRRLRVAGLPVLVAACALTACTHQPGGNGAAPAGSLPLREVGRVALPGDTSRFDYAGLDSGRGLLFIAHLGASEIVEVDLHTNRVVRTIDGITDVHGVLVVPARHRVYATATGADQVLTMDEDTGAVLARSPTGAYPDGLAYDQRRNQVWTTNESGGSETVIDATTGTVRGTVHIGHQAGNVAYDQAGDQILADAQADNDLAVIDPVTLTVTRRVPLPGCDHDHGLALDRASGLAFIACDGNAQLLTVDLHTWTVTARDTIGQDPDVLAWDSAAQRLYVAAESGTVTVLDLRGRTLTTVGRGHLADGAHVVAVDPTTHRSYYPIANGPDGHPALLEEAARPA